MKCANTFFIPTPDIGADAIRYVGKVYLEDQQDSEYEIFWDKSVQRVIIHSLEGDQWFMQKRMQIRASVCDLLATSHTLQSGWSYMISGNGVRENMYEAKVWKICLDTSNTNWRQVAIDHYEMHIRARPMPPPMLPTRQQAICM